MDRLNINIAGNNLLKVGNNLLGSSFFTSQLFGSLDGTLKWVGGVLAPNGKIYGIPRGSTQVLEIDKSTNTKPNAFDMVIPADLTNLAASKYNEYSNKL